MSSVTHTLGNLGTKLFLYPLTFLVSIFLAKYLEPEEKGLYAYIIILTSFFIPIFSIRFGRWSCLLCK